MGKGDRLPPAYHPCTTTSMVEILKTNDLVLLSYVQHRLAEEGIEALVFDGYMSAVEGSIGAFPRRIMVADKDLYAARQALGNIALTIDG